MGNKHLSNVCHKVRGKPDVWWYEEPRGIEIHTVQNDGSTIAVIEWKLIRSALARKDKPKDA